MNAQYNMASREYLCNVSCQHVKQCTNLSPFNFQIEAEFRQIFPGKASQLITKWPVLKDVIIDYGTQQCTVWKEVLQMPGEDVKNLSEGKLLITRNSYLILRSCKLMLFLNFTFF